MNWTMMLTETHAYSRAHLEGAAPTGGRTDALGVGEQCDGFEPRGVVRPHRPRQHEDLVMRGRGHSQGTLQQHTETH